MKQNLHFNFKINDSESQFDVGICLTPVGNIISVKLQYIGQGWEFLSVYDKKNYEQGHRKPVSG